MGSNALRRYPALGFIAVAAALALLLPSTLRAPASQPSSLSEFAPVPGSSDGRSDIATLEQPGSGDLGFGTGRGAGRATPAPAPVREGLRQPDPAQKRCVGNPPRQTEDPLSPPCVASFTGDNGGATARGVSADEITVVLHFQVGETDPQNVFVDCQEPTTPTDGGRDVACKAFAKFFNERYQLYGRTAHLYAYHGRTSGENAGAEAADIETKEPFLVAGVGLNTSGTVLSHMSEYGSAVASYEGLNRTFYARHAPRAYGFRPDHDVRLESAAAYVCTKLVGGPARYSGNPLDTQRTRVFGLFAGTGPEGPIFKRYLDETCGVQVFEEPLSASGLARLRDSGVTTVLTVAGTASQWAQMSHASAGQGWFPEWIVPGAGRAYELDTNRQARLFNQTVWRRAFGITADYRRDRLADQVWYQAHTEGCPDCGTPSADNAAILYDTLTMMFYGIQTAGPRLTVANLDKGLHSIPHRPSPDPRVPAAYFEQRGYTYVKDAMEIWWDPQGRAPDTPQPGCYRVPNGGTRFRAGEWPRGDDGLFVPDDRTAPCQGPVGSLG